MFRNKARFLIALCSLMIVAILVSTFGGHRVRALAVSCSGDYAEQYFVLDGDTLSSIAASYQVDTSQLMSHNPSITDPNMISVGQAICVPGIGGVENLQHSGPPSREEMVQHYIDVARRDALEYGLNSDYFVRQIQLESGFQPDQVSPQGAIGIAQLMPSTAATYHIDPRDPDKSLDVAAQIMESYLKEYNWDNAKALAAYNAGDGAVQNAITQYGDSWQLGLPWETQQYIKNVMYP